MDFKSIISGWQPKASAFFSTFPWKNVLLFLLFLLLAFVFWLMLFFQRDVEGVYRIPLKYTNVPHDVVFDDPLPQFVEIRVSGKGSEMFRLDFSSRDSLEINVQDLKNNNIHELQRNQMQQLIGSRLSSGTNLQGYLPAIISLQTSQLQKKELTVKFDGEITTSRANLVADSATFIPEKVTAYGSRQHLEKLTAAVTEYKVFNNVRSTSQLNIKIKPVDGVKFVPSEVEIYIPVQEFTERTVEVPITARNVPAGMDVKFFPSRVNVSFSVTLEEYRKIAPEDFEIKLNYSDFSHNQDGRVQIELTQKPSSAINVRLSPASVEFLLESR